MKFSSFKRPKIESKRTVHTPIPEHMRVKSKMSGKIDTFSGCVEKEGSIQHDGYMDIVRSMPCAHCGRAPRSQFCHSDEGKGMGIKSDCRYGWPGCDVCHDAIGTRRIYPRHQRRKLEAEMARQTREQIIKAGKWPKSLPMLKEDEAQGCADS